MYGQTAGESTYGGELPYWRAFVVATTVAAAPANVVGTGNPIAQGIGLPGADAQALTHAVAVGNALADLVADAQVKSSGVVLIQATSAIAAAVNQNLTTVSVVGATSAIVERAESTPIPVAIGTAHSCVVNADVQLAPTSAAVSAAGTSIMTAVGTIDSEAAASESVPLYEGVEPGLAPLIGSHEADELETELKALFVEMFETYVRPDERYVNLLGMPQLGTRELIETSLASDGLSIYRGANVASGAGAYLLRAWRAHNPKRGLHLLHTYLQLLWPNVWTADQMWQDKAEDYPLALATTDGGNHFLTSRINVTLPARVTSGGDLNAIQSGLRAALPARMLMELAVESEDSFGIGIATAFVPGLVAQSYEGTIAA